MAYTHTHMHACGHHSAFKKKKEIQQGWLRTLSKISQSQKDKYYMIPLCKIPRVAKLIEKGNTIQKKNQFNS